MRHHAGAYFSRFRLVAPSPSTSFLHNPQVARVDKGDVVRIFFQPLRVGADRIGGTLGIRREARLGMTVVLGLLVGRRTHPSTWRNYYCGIARVTIDTAQAYRPTGMHSGTVSRGMAADAAFGFSIGLSLRLQQ